MYTPVIRFLVFIGGHESLCTFSRAVRILNENQLGRLTRIAQFCQPWTGYLGPPAAVEKTNRFLHYSDLTSTMSWRYHEEIQFVLVR